MKNRLRFLIRLVLRGILGAVVMLAAFAASWMVLFQEGASAWGAGESETRAEYPGDRWMPDAVLRSTRAVSIAAPPEKVWPWLMQIGQDRGGFYSYEWLENLAGSNIRGVDRLIPEFTRERQPGEKVWLADPSRFDGQMHNVVVEAHAPDRLVLCAPPDMEAIRTRGLASFFLWSFAPRSDVNGNTRLIVRSSYGVDYPQTGVVSLMHFLMERKMLAELSRLAGGGSTDGGSSEVIWFAALVLSALLLWAASMLSPWHTGWLIGAPGMALWSMVLFQAWPSAIAGGVLALLSVIILIWSWRQVGVNDDGFADPLS
ncbi:MAG: hypothetical protein GMKNLPBB_01954 [Myxococcota bacterium]|nr:hypothetical protein [Myxococcota bacterium]